jgi:hypothetical protein
MLRPSVGVDFATKRKMRAGKYRCLPQTRNEPEHKTVPFLVLVHQDIIAVGGNFSVHLNWKLKFNHYVPGQHPTNILKLYQNKPLGFVPACPFVDEDGRL